MKKNLKVAIVHDWLIGGGAERVIEELHRMFPDAPIYTSYATNEWRKRLDGKVVTGWLQNFGKLRKFLAVARIRWFEHLDLSSYDVVISSSGNGEAFSVRTSPSTLHINYCHTPTHYYWRHYDQYVAQPGFGAFDPFARFGLKLLFKPLRSWDYKAAQRADVMLANSTHIQKDIQTFYGRSSTVVHPPVDIERFLHVTQPAKRRGFVAMGRLAPAKHFDIIVQACSQLNLPLKVIGDGPELPRLKQLAGDSVTFFSQTDGNRVSDQDMPAHLASAGAFLFASFDDFGIAPVEALAAGTPVIAFKAGGALDYVIPGKTGQFFHQQTVASLKKALQAFEPDSYNPRTVQAKAKQFSAARFSERIARIIEQHLAARQR